MAPAGLGKRKRGDRTYSQDGGREEGQRPSPHRPGELSLGQHNTEPRPAHGPNFEPRGGGRRRGGGGRGNYGGGPQRSPLTSPNGTVFQGRPGQAPAESPTTAPQSQQFPSESKLPSTNSNPPAQSATNHVQPKDVNKDAVKGVHYYYEYITDRTVETWEGEGRSQTVNVGVEAKKSKDQLVLGVLFQELIQAGLYERLTPTQAGSAINDILQEDSQPQAEAENIESSTDFDAGSLFLDTLSIVAEFAVSTPALVSLVTSTGISASKMRRELDSTLLENLGLVRKNIFVRVGIRQQTNLLYRQSNYNLLREETEGYSKLVTDLFATSSDELPTSGNVEETFERVKGMIGAFDLDVGRVLDISLDVFATVLVKQYRFFVKYFRTSSWWPVRRDTKSDLDPRLGPLPRWALPGASARPLSEDEREEIRTARIRRDEAFWQRAKEIGVAAYFELGGRQTDPPSLEAAMDDTTDFDSTHFEETRKWIDMTHTLPPPGNKVAAQVLGFKLRFYNSSARDPSDVLPMNLIYLAALLIKIGFVSLRDLYPHIWPADDAMEGVRDEKMKEKAEKEKLNRPGGGAPNALLSAAPLPDDTIEGQGREATRLREAEAARRQPSKANSVADRSTPVAQVETKADELPEPSEQKVQLLKSLLSIGALPEALYMLGRFPWLPEVFPELPEYIHRILHHSLGKVYQSLYPIRSHGLLQEQQFLPDMDQSGMLKGHVKLAQGPPRKRKRWAQLDQDNVNEKDEVVDYRFYWDDWADTIPVCQNVDDVFVLCSTLLNLSGVKIGQDPQLLMKLARIGSHSVATDQSAPNMSRWLDLSKRLLVPALSFTRCNPGVVHEVFELIKNFPYPTRFGIYAEWYSGPTSRQPDIKSAFEQAKAETKDVLKRISKTTIKPMARALAKVAYASPGVVFSVAIAQLESYENIVDAVVECARYFTYLAYDVLTWSLLSALGAQGRNRVQSDGMLTSRWLAALALFAGKVFKRYSVMNPTPVFQYVAEQLRQANPTDLIVLEEITKSMAGIVSDSSFNEQQVLAMAGGDLLQAQTMLQLLDRRHESKTTAKRLMKSLTDSKLAGQILVSLAQERQTCIFKIEEQNAHPKLLGNLVDQLHRIFAQYMDLLRGNLSIRDFDQLVPSVVQLITDFGIDPNIAFWISRPSLVMAVAEHDSKNSAQASKKLRAAKEPSEEETAIEEEVKDIDMKDAVVAPQATQASTPTPQSALAKVEGEDIEMEGTNGSSVAPDALEAARPETTTSEPWHAILKDVMQGLEQGMPKSTWDAMSPGFFVTFWQCSLRDIYLPLQSYETEINRQRKKVQAINADRSDLSIVGTQRKEKEKKTLQELEDRLQTESKERLQHYTAVRRRLQKEKDHWFSPFWGKWDSLNVALIEQCFFPRMIISAIDAKYTFNMLRYLHSSGAANFRTMGVYDQLFKDHRLTSMMFLCSAKESEYFGRFLSEVLQELGKWHASKATFEKEAYGLRKDLPGFSKKLSNEQSVVSFWDYEDFRRIMFKWHRNLSNALKTCLTSKEYMHIRNAINVLNNVHKHFPVVTFMGQHQLTCVTELSQKETREDLKIAAASLLGALKKREKDWVMPQAFNMGENAANATARPGSSKPSTPRPDADRSNKSLNPKAPEFEPRLEASEEVRVDKAPSKTADAEDGEIEDATSIKTKVEEHTHKPTDQVDELKVNVPQNNGLLTDQSQDPPKPAPSLEEKASESVPEGSDPNLKPQGGPLRKPMPALGPANSSVPMRPEVSRNSSFGQVNSRAHHELPSRPEIVANRTFDNRQSARMGDRPPDHQREARAPERALVDSPKEYGRERFHDRPLPSSQSHTPERNDGRLRGTDRERNERHGGDILPTMRIPNDERQDNSLYRDPRPPFRDRASLSSDSRSILDPNRARRDFHSNEQSERDAAMLPPRSTVSHHPDRAALIQGGSDGGRLGPSARPLDRRSEGSRYNDNPNSEQNSRAASPTRTHDRPPPHEIRRGVERRQEDGYRTMEEGQFPRSRYDDTYAPSGPRNDRTTSMAASSPNDRFRETARSSASGGPAHDFNHGRLNQDGPRSGWQNESQYGRLNAGNDTPAGPRLSNGHNPHYTRGGRHTGLLPGHDGLQQTPPTQSSTPSHSAPGKQNSNRPSPHNGANESSHPPFEGQVSPTAPTSGGTVDVGTVHPDRLKAIQGGGSAANSVPSDRVETNRGPRNPPPLSVPPPTSARGSLPSPIQQSPTGRGGPPPSGPAFANDRNRDKRFAGIQNVLQQSNGPPPPDRSGQGTSIRGRGGRGPITPSGNGPMPSHAPRDAGPAREDLFAGRMNGSLPSGPVEDDGAYGRGNRRGPPGRDAPQEVERKSTRHRSRSPKADRSFDTPPSQYRERERPAFREDSRENFREDETNYNIRSNGLPDRDARRPPGFPERDIRAGPPPRRSTREVAGDGRGGQEGGYDRRGEERRDGGGSMRKRGRGVEEMVVERPVDTKRPRR